MQASGVHLVNSARHDTLFSETSHSRQLYTVQQLVSKHVKGSTERYLLGQKYNLHIFGVILFMKPQNDT